MNLFNNYHEARKAYSAAKGSVILRRTGAGWLVLRTADIVRGITYNETAQFARQFNGNYIRSDI